MNTPPPCDSCRHLYYDCMRKDDPDDSAECKKGHELGSECEDYEHWQSTHQHCQKTKVEARRVEEVTLIQAAKILLSHCLYIVATVEERNRGLYGPPDGNLSEALEVLKKMKPLPEGMAAGIFGGITMEAAIKAAEYFEEA